MIVVVEPHADDAYLSLGAHIERWTGDGEKVAILTVFSGTRKRAVDAETYAQRVGAYWMGLGLVESGGSEVVDLPVLDLPPYRRIIFPLGLHHPEHKAVAAQAPADASFYVETPYQLVQANNDELAALIVGREIVSWRTPPMRKWRHHGVFKDQAQFMRFNPPSALARAPEVIVK